jgi:transcriptional regulator with XRE-family HTH domain
MPATPHRIGARLRSERLARRMTVDSVAEAFRDAAGERDRRRMPKLEDLRRTIRGHEAGEHPPGPRYQMLYAAVFGMAEADLFGADDVAQVARTSEVNHDDEIEALELSRRATASDVGGETLRLLEQAVDDLATATPGRRRPTC